MLPVITDALGTALADVGVLLFSTRASEPPSFRHPRLAGDIDRKTGTGLAATYYLGKLSP